MLTDRYDAIGELHAAGIFLAAICLIWLVGFLMSGRER